MASFGRLQRMVSRLAAMLGLMLAMQSVSAAEAPRVVTSIRPLHSLLAGIMQGVADPVLLLDGSGPPWDFEPDRADRAQIAASDLVVWSGAELEPGLAALMETLSPSREHYEVLASSSLKILPARHDDSRRDPFYWLDSRNMLILLDDLARRVIGLDPDRAPVYERNWRRVATAIGEVDRALEFGYRGVSGVPVFLYHDTHQYFQQAYAMHVAGSASRIGQSRELDTAQLLKMRSLVARAGKTCIFTEKAFDEAHAALLTTGTEARLIELDSLGIGKMPGPGLYVELMRDNFAKISGCIESVRPRPEPTAADAYPVPDVRRFPDRIRPIYLMRDQHGRSVANTDFNGRFQLINFGYTFCPDVCPTSLAIMSRAMGLLGGDADQVQPIFITVDPLRDTPAVLAEYVAYFDQRMLGLSASPETTKRTAELFRARYEKVPAQDGDPDRYIMDHTASLFLLGRRGEFITKFAHGLPAQQVAARLREEISR